uniref:Putative secreted protein n=1 Tax=Anopheles darlingi TaxID=43151 RepID=A0A2M4DDI5_ANODA
MVLAMAINLTQGLLPTTSSTPRITDWLVNICCQTTKCSRAATLFARLHYRNGKRKQQANAQPLTQAS